MMLKKAFAKIGYSFVLDIKQAAIEMTYVETICKFNCRTKYANIVLKAIETGEESHNEGYGLDEDQAINKALRNLPACIEQSGNKEKIEIDCEKK
jgi:hypothetical protein